MELKEIETHTHGFRDGLVESFMELKERVKNITGSLMN
ncbi:hypothetical protein Mcup_1119 [Metallosphaera cuprina Ar-4]|uniref:Uncharacterized protein n=1 Tax=Metallosphaera cuprina (strain Ar-4) TaxID=1006006 RepID=F4G326_METCR|nr:hypothetical protein Mcup_1119 [Metallosphaera cuprina Ar-4]